jgi:hypothetical protein
LLDPDAAAVIAVAFVVIPIMMFFVGIPMLMEVPIIRVILRAP